MKANSPERVLSRTEITYGNKHKRRRVRVEPKMYVVQAEPVLRLRYVEPPFRDPTEWWGPMLAALTTATMVVVICLAL